MSYGDWSSDVCSSDLLPAYQDYTIRAKMSEVILAMSSCRTSITEVYQSGPTNAPAVNGWGCEILKIGRASCRERVEVTEADGVVKDTVKGSCSHTKEE